MCRRKGDPKKHDVLVKCGTKNFYIRQTTFNTIRNLQKTTRPCIPKLPFSRVIREIMLEFTGKSSRIERQALMALQEAAETYLVQLFEDSNLCANHANRLTVRPSDMKLVFDIKKN